MSALTRTMIVISLAATTFTLTRMAHSRFSPALRPYDVLRYDLALTLDPASQGLSGTNRVTFRTTASLSSIRLDASSRTMIVDSVTGIDGRHRINHSGNVLQIFFPGTLPESDTQTVRIHYRALSAFDGRYDSGGIYFSPGSGPLRVGTISQPNFAREWWPCNDRPSDKALLSLSCTVPQNTVVISNGRPLPAGADGNRRTYFWESAYPIATYLVFLGAADYTVAVDTMRMADGGVLNLAWYSYPEDSSKAAYDFGNTKAILKYFSETFGPYPFIQDKFAIAEVDGRLTMENQTVVTIEKELITGDRRNENTLVHEIAHQWWGNQVTPSSWKHIWLAEAFATYSEALYIESRKGPETYAQYINVLMDQPEGSYTDPVIGNDSSRFWDSFSPAVYYKGALVLHMLRRMMGDDHFFASLREFLGGPPRKYGNASTEEFFDICEKHHGSGLGWFAMQWLTPSRGAADRPEIAVSWSQAETAGTFTLQLSLRQEQGGDRPYRLPMKVRVFTGGSIDTFSLIDSLQEQSFNRPVASPIDSVVVDPERDLFMTIRRSESE